MPRTPTLADVNEARWRLRGIALHTPLEPSRELAEESSATEVRLKREDVQPTGAFKTRGAHNKVGILAEGRPEAALVTASSGNHGIAVATAAVRHDMRLTVLVGKSVSPAKLERLGIQREDLMSCLDALLQEAQAGRAYFKLYHQFKMYNDPALNPYLNGQARDGGRAAP